MQELYYWKCHSCGETLQGFIHEGDFISDKELYTRAKRYRAAGCYLCGCPSGEIGDEVDEDNDYYDEVN